MGRLDSKLVKKVNQSELIQASKIMEVKNAEKVTKENLIPAFMKKVEDKVAEVEALSKEEQEDFKLDDLVVKMYNFLVKTFGLEEEEGGEKEKEKEGADAKSEKEGGEKKMAKEKKEKKEKKEAKKNGYSRIHAFCDAVKSKKSGTMESLIATADQKYVAKGGSSNSKESAWNCNLGIRFLVGMGQATLEEGSYKLL